MGPINIIWDFGGSGGMSGNKSPVITWIPFSPITYGTLLTTGATAGVGQLNASVNYTGTVTYNLATNNATPSDFYPLGDVVNGIVYNGTQPVILPIEPDLNGNSYTLTCNFTPFPTIQNGHTILSGTSSANLQILQATPTISWTSNPVTSITDQTPIITGSTNSSASLLDSSVIAYGYDGVTPLTGGIWNFYYINDISQQIPLTGQTLTSGTYTLGVIFTPSPTDSLNYNDGTSLNSITIISMTTTTTTVVPTTTTTTTVAPTTTTTTTVAPTTTTTTTVAPTTTTTTTVAPSTTTTTTVAPTTTTTTTVAPTTTTTTTVAPTTTTTTTVAPTTTTTTTVSTATVHPVITWSPNPIIIEDDQTLGETGNLNATASDPTTHNPVPPSPSGFTYKNLSN